MPLARVARLEIIPAEQLELAAGRAVIQYRGRMLPLVSVPHLLEGAPSPENEMLHAVVYRSGACDIGIVVDEIVDVVDDVVDNLFATDRSGLLGSALVGGVVTDFLDLEALSQWAQPAGADSLALLEAALAHEQVPAGVT